MKMGKEGMGDMNGEGVSKLTQSEPGKEQGIGKPTQSNAKE
jgi:hypothetical protein